MVISAGTFDAMPPAGIGLNLLPTSSFATITVNGTLASGDNTALFADTATNAVINVAGTIRGDGLGVHLLNGADNRIVIAPGGLITATTVGVRLAGNILNTTVENNGVILGSTGIGVGILGSINADMIVNSGEISGGSGTALDLLDGADILELRAGHSFGGVALGGLGADTLRFGGSADASFDLSQIAAAGQFQGFEILEKTGASRWILTGTTMFAGSTIIAQGALVLAAGASLPSLVTVNGGSLDGIGTVGGILVNAGGTLAPGIGGIGTLNVGAGGVILGAGSTYVAEVEAAGGADFVDAQSAVAIDAGAALVVVVQPGAYAASTVYPILRGTTLTGTFATVTLSGLNPAFFTASLGTVANTLELTLDYQAQAFALFAQTPNQRAVAEVMTALGVQAPFLDVFTTLSNQEVARGLDILSGEIHATTLGRLIDPGTGFAALLRGRLTSAFDVFGSGEPTAYADPSDPWNRLFADGRALGAGASASTQATAAAQRYLWMSMQGRRGTIFGDGNAAAANTAALALYGGLDMPLAPNVRLGFAAGWSRTDTGAEDRLSTSRAQAWHVAGTLAASFDNLNVRGLLAYTGYDIDTDRTIVVGTKTYGTAQANYGATRLEAMAEIGYVFRLTSANVEPYAAIGSSWLHSNGFVETGVPKGNLLAEPQRDTAPFGTLGVRLAGQWKLGDMTLTPRLDLGWRHMFGDTESVRRMTLVMAPEFSWLVKGLPVARDMASVEAGLDALVTDSFTASIRYRGEFSRTGREHGVSASVSFRF